MTHEPLDLARPAAVEFATLDRLTRQWLPHLPTADLDALRRELRGNAWATLGDVPAPPAALGALAVPRVQLLRDVVTRELCRRHGIDPADWPIVGDVLPDAPSDVSALDDGAVP